VSEVSFDPRHSVSGSVVLLVVSLAVSSVSVVSVVPLVVGSLDPLESAVEEVLLTGAAMVVSGLLLDVAEYAVSAGGLLVSGAELVGIEVSPLGSDDGVLSW